MTDMNLTYVATVLNSMIRMSSPILLAALTAAICSKVKVFNIGMEGTMMAGAFFSIVANYYTHSVLLSVCAGALSGLIISAINAVCIIRFKAAATVVGMAMNTLMTGATTYLLYVIFGVRGVFTDSSLVPLPKVTLPIIKDIPYIGEIISGQNILVYLSLILMVVCYIVMYKTPFGLRLRGVGIKAVAAQTVGINAVKYKWIAILISGVFSGLGGAYLTIGGSSMFTENISAGKGFLALAAIMVGNGHPIKTALACLVFGYTQALSVTLQSMGLPSQIVISVPYLITIAIMFVSAIIMRMKVQSKKLGA